MDEGTPPTVSVIIPTYNRAEMLSDSTASVLSQGYQDLELLIIDDGSTDRTPDLVLQIQSDDGRVRYIQHPQNLGVGAARDTGIKNARGDYIAFADSDDLWLAGKLEQQVNILEEHPQIDILFADFINHDLQSGARTNAFTQTRLGLAQLDTTPVDGDLWMVNDGLARGLLIKNFIQLGTLLIRRELIARVGSFYSQLSGPEDFEFCWRAAVRGARYAFTRDIFVERRINPSSITTNQVGSWCRYIEALHVCKQTATTASRSELLASLQSAEQRAWRNLIWIHGSNAHRSQAFSAYQQSLQVGFSAKNLFFLSTALIGPSAIGLSRKLMGIREQFGNLG